MRASRALVLAPHPARTECDCLLYCARVFFYMYRHALLASHTLIIARFALVFVCGTRPACHTLLCVGSTTCQTGSSGYASDTLLYIYISTSIGQLTRPTRLRIVADGPRSSTSGPFVCSCLACAQKKHTSSTA